MAILVQSGSASSATPMQGRMELTDDPCAKMQDRRMPLVSGPAPVITMYAPLGRS